MTSLNEKTINNALTRANASEIDHWTMPKTSAAVDEPSSGFTAPSNGYVIALSNSLLSKTCNIYVNGLLVAKWTISGSGASFQGRQVIPVRKGDIITTSEMSTLTFVPCVGG